MFFEVSIVAAVFFGWISQVAFQKAIFKAFGMIGNNPDRTKIENYITRWEIISKTSAVIAVLSLIAALTDTIIS